MVDDVLHQNQLFRCKVCDKPAGPDLIHCPRRSEGGCPYEVVTGTPQHSESNLGAKSLGMAIGALLLGITLGYIVIMLVMIIRDGNYNSLVGLVCLIPFGTLGVVLVYSSLSSLYSRRELIYDPETGFLWERHKFLFWQTLCRTILGKERLAVNLPLDELLSLPVSLSTLRVDLVQERVIGVGKAQIDAALNQSIFTFAATLFHLLSENALTMWRTNAYFDPHANAYATLADGFAYVLTLGTKHDQIEGHLEKLMIMAVRHWSANMQTLDRSRLELTEEGAGRLQGGLSISDLVYKIFSTSFAAAYYANVIATVMQGAIKLGLAEEKPAQGYTLQAALSPFGIAQLEQNAPVVRAAYAHLSEQHPDLVKVVESQVKDGILRRRFE